MKNWKLLWTIFWLAGSLLCLGLGIKNFFDEKDIFARLFNLSHLDVSLCLVSSKFIGIADQILKCNFH